MQVTIEMNRKALDKEVTFIQKEVIEKAQGRIRMLMDKTRDIAVLANADNPDSIEIVDTPDGIEIRSTRESALFIERQAEFFFEGTPENAVKPFPKALEDLEK